MECRLPTKTTTKSNNPAFSFQHRIIYQQKYTKCRHVHTSELKFTGADCHAIPTAPCFYSIISESGLWHTAKGNSTRQGQHHCCTGERDRQRDRETHRQTDRQTDRQTNRQRQRNRDWRRLLTGRYEVPAPLLSPAVNVKLMESAEWRRTWQFGWPDVANFCLFVCLACFLLWAQWIQFLWLDFIVTGYLCITIAHNMFIIIRYGNVNYIHYSFQYLQVA